MGILFEYFLYSGSLFKGVIENECKIRHVLQLDPFSEEEFDVSLGSLGLLWSFFLSSSSP